MAYKLRITLWFLLLVLIGAFTAVTPAVATSNVEGAQISIPILKLHAAIVEAPWVELKNGYGTWDVASLRNNVAHLERTSWINDSHDKNIVLAGHNRLPNGKPAIFFSLDKLRNGDQLILTQNGLTFSYFVTEKHFVSPDDLSVIRTAGQDQLTLITCAGVYNIDTNDYSKRLIIVAVRR